MRRDFHGWVNLFASLGARLKSRLYYPLVFGSFGRSSVLYRPVFLSHPKYIHIGEGTLIRPGVRLEVVITDPAEPPEIRIGNNVNIEQNVHIVGVGKIEIGDDVSLNANCAIMCGSHPFLDVAAGKVGTLVTGAKDRVAIGRGAFLGIGACVMTNVVIGERAVVGTASVVKEDLPAYCVATGNPAVVVAQYDLAEERWKRVRKDSGD